MVLRFESNPMCVFDREPEGLQPLPALQRQGGGVPRKKRLSRPVHLEVANTMSSYEMHEQTDLLELRTVHIATLSFDEQFLSN